MDKKSAVLQFIEKERATGASDLQIQHHLLDAGWHMDIIQRAMGTELSSPPKKLILTTEKKKLDIRKMQFLGAGMVLVVLMLLAIFI